MDPYYADDWLTVYLGDCRAVLATLPADSVNCVITSPPYYGLRDYGEAGQIGLEPTPEQYVAELVAVFREVRRVMRPDGTCWLNLGDSYNAGTSSARKPTPDSTVGYWQEAGGMGDRRVNAPGLKPKDRMMIPARVALALQADGWWLRDEIVWSKPNPMPSSVTDRTTPAHEMVYLLTKRARYWSDFSAIRDPLAESSIQRINQPTFDKQTGGPKDYANGTNPNQSARKALESFATKHRRTPAGWNVNHDQPNTVGQYEQGEPSDKDVAPGRNKRSVWTIATQPYPEAHFATFPEALVEPMVLAGCPEGGLVLDPFAGSGTVGLVAQRLSRRAILIDLSAEYMQQLMKRNQDMPLGLVAS